MAQNFLYMFEFVVDDLLITRPNKCAPEEYPTCVEITFRSSVFVAVCDREYGECIDMCSPKCGKCILFSLESPVTEKDRVMIHVYKKKNDSCKFLLGATDMPIKPMFDKVTDGFDAENPNWMERVTRHNACMPDPKQALKRGEAPAQQPQVDNCYDEFEGRKEQFCPTSELNKSLLPLFSMRGEQTGNIMLITRLVCNGPAIVSSFPFSRFCKAGCADCCCGRSTKQSSVCPSPRRSSRAKPSMSCSDMNSDDAGPCRMPNPCQETNIEKPICQRYFACNDDKGCPCDQVQDYGDRGCDTGCKNACKPKRKSKKSCSQSRSSSRQSGGVSNPKESDDCDITEDKGYNCDECCIEGCEEDKPCQEGDKQCSMDSVLNVPPCSMEPSSIVFGPEAYHEYVACFNGTSVTIRVLKDTHTMSSNSYDQINSNQCCDCSCGDNDNNLTLEELLEDRNFVRKTLPKHLARGTPPKLPVPGVKANIQYAGEDDSCANSYNVPFTKIKNLCLSKLQSNKLDQYRKIKHSESTCGPTTSSTDLHHTRSCCLQVDPEEIKNLLKGINADARKKGIEVCYKSCDDEPDTEVFLVRLGSKKACERKRPSVEIELRTPKMPIICPILKCTTETQIIEEELDAVIEEVCRKGKKKGKKGKKGKK